MKNLVRTISKGILFSGILLICFTGCSYMEVFNSTNVTSDEAITILSKESLYQSKINFESLDKNNFQKYFTIIDKYASYFSKNEYEAYLTTLSPHYSGIGMLIYQEKKEKAIKCIPFDNKLIRKGISIGDSLISIDDETVEGQNFYIISSKIRGPKGSFVKLKIKKTSGNEKSLKIVRTHQEYKTTKVIYENGIKKIKIVQFTKETPDELLKCIMEFSLREPIVIDLSNNIGGDLFSAIESADLFLPKDTYIVSLKTNFNEESYYALNKDYTNDKKIILIQNHLTASAAEVFIAALTENNRAESIGRKSFGKGVAQKIVPLNDGSAILFTYASLITPNGKKYNNKGLYPTDERKLKDIVLDNMY